MNRKLLLLALIMGMTAVCASGNGILNLRVVTDASPDTSDMNSLIHSTTAKWETPEQKVWALFYWTHLGRRQTQPMVLHGMALTDPIRQFNDYGQTMCSTVAGMNCAMWDAMGFRARYWDITRHTVAEVEYDGRWHMIDNSLSALYTLCDGTTLAGVEDIGATLACPVSDGKVEPGHIARYHCLTATGTNGFLTGSDTARSLVDEAGCFNPKGLMYRYYYYDWDRGHRYSLNLREGETYTRTYHPLGDDPEYYVPNHGRDPDDKRFHIRGNGLWTFQPKLTEPLPNEGVLELAGLQPNPAGGVSPKAAGTPGSAVFVVKGANVITGLTLDAMFRRQTAADQVALAVSTTNGLHWSEIPVEIPVGTVPTEVTLVEAVNGAYRVLVRVTLTAAVRPDDLALQSIGFRTLTMLNSKMQPRLNLGRNTVFVGAGEQTESIVFWPDLRGERYREFAAETSNIATDGDHPGYQGTMYAARPGQDAMITFRMDAPHDLVRTHYGGRLYNRAPGSSILFQHSFDAGTTWQTAYTLSDTQPPWDVIHFVDIDVPPGIRSALFRYVLRSPEAGKAACSLYSVRMEGFYHPVAGRGNGPVDVTFRWQERQEDWSLIPRSHTQRVAVLPARYILNVGGKDHPVMEELEVCRVAPESKVVLGYADRVDPGGERYLPRWVTYGTNLAEGKPYTVSVPSTDRWGSGDPDGRKLTDGIVGPPFAGGGAPAFALGWDKGTEPVVTVDLGASHTCAAFRIDVGAGWPWWDSLKGEIQDRVLVSTSLDGDAFADVGPVPLNLRLKDIPINHMLPDDESLCSYLFTLVPAAPVTARYVRFTITPQRSLCISEIQVLDALQSKPFDMRVALPDDVVPGGGEQAKVLTPAGRPVPARLAAANQAKALGEPLLEAPTLHSLGVVMLVGGDANRNAALSLAVRPAGTTEWLPAPDLFRVERGAHRDDNGGSSIEVPDDAWLFAGSALLLQPDTAYEMLLRLADPDGGAGEWRREMRTLAEPSLPPGMRVRYVAPGNGGGSGTEYEPYLGLAVAEASAQPGDLFLLRPGTYRGTFTLAHSGTPDHPIVWQSAEAGKAILDAADDDETPAPRGISASGLHDVWFEGLTVRRADFGMVLHDSARIVVRRCRIDTVDYGIACTRNTDGVVTGIWLSDNVIEGPSTWPRSKGIENARGIQITGTGNVVCYNRIYGFADAVDTFPSVQCTAIDIHNNDISVMTDDGIEMDYSQRNTRCFHNRLINTFTGISVQPVFGGPVYIFRNAMANQVYAPFKIHNSPSGVLLFHNTAIKAGMPLGIMTGAPVRNCVSRNNLFVGSEANYAFESTAPMQDCDFDYDGFAGGPWQLFLKWNGERYRTAAEARAGAPVYGHALELPVATLFAGGLLPPTTSDDEWVDVPELSLNPDSPAIDAGVRLPGINDAYTGGKPDLGAYELGTPMPHYGPRPKGEADR